MRESVSSNFRPQDQRIQNERGFHEIKLYLSKSLILNKQQFCYFIMTTKPLTKMSITNKKKNISDKIKQILKPKTFIPKDFILNSKSLTKLIFFIALLSILTGCNSNKSSEDFLVSGLIRELNSQRNLTIYDDIQRIVFNMDNSKNTENTNELLNYINDPTNDPKIKSEEFENRYFLNYSDKDKIIKNNSNQLPLEENKISTQSLSPIIISPSTITLKVGEPLNLDYYVYDFDSDYLKVWVEGWDKKDNYITTLGDEGVHTITIYASDYESVSKSKIIINVIRKPSIFDLKLTHSIN